MRNTRTALTYLVTLLVLVWGLQREHQQIQTVHAQGTNADCSWTFTFTGNANSPGHSNASTGTPCVAFRITYSATGTLSSVVAFQTSPDNSTFTSVPNTICSTSVQPPCVTEGANPTANAASGNVAVRAYGIWTRVAVTGSSGTGTGTVTVYGYKGTSAAVGTGGGGGGAAGATGATGPSGPSGPAGSAGSAGAAGATGATGPSGAAGNGASITVYSGTAGVALSGTVFFPIGGGNGANATEASVDANIQVTSTISNFGVELSAALGVGNSVVFTWRKNAGSQTVTCTISGASATSCNDTTHSFTTVPGDLLAIQAVFSGTIVVTPIFIMTAQVGLAGAAGSGLLPWNPAASTPPILSGWTQINTGGNGTFADVTGGVLVNTVSGNNIKGLYRATPGASGSTFTITGHVSATCPGNDAEYGILVGDSSANYVSWTIKNFGTAAGNNQNQVDHTPNTGIPASAPFSGTGMSIADEWLRIKYDGTNLLFQISATGADAASWLQRFSELASAGLVGNPARIGLFAYPAGGAGSCIATLGYWLVTQP